MTLNQIGIERLQQIEAERAVLSDDPQFCAWMEEMHVGRLYVDRSGIIRANEMMQQYVTPKRLTFKDIVKTIFNF
jgi:hypothetical protein